MPLQIFEVVSAAPIDETASTAAAGAPHAVVRADMCVGCGTCVSVCPEPGAIRLEGKLAVIERPKCLGHGKCAEACPVGAIALATGDAVHRVEVPMVHPDFQSNVRGIYIVGELGGRGLIKNAINEGSCRRARRARTGLPGRSTWSSSDRAPPG
jgi:ferredoxin